MNRTSVTGPASEFGMASQDKFILEEGLRIVTEAETKGVILRILGAIAFMHHSQNFSGLFRDLARLGKENLFTDIDLIGYKKQRKDIRELMEDQLKFEVDRHVLMLHSDRRLIYYHPKNQMIVDIFLDALQFSHDLVFGTDPKNGRLNLDYPTIPLPDLLLQKLQIHEINEKDLKDIFALVRAHSLSNDTTTRDAINLNRICEVLSEDWGFWKDSVTNLTKTQELASQLRDKGLISEEDRNDFFEKTTEILGKVENYPKSKNWIKRAKAGASKPWWSDVDEILR